jgi:hypothetical protein
MILHSVALGFAVGELVLTSVARRGRPHATAGVVASVAMVAAMADSGLFAPRILSTVAWTVILLAIALSMALVMRVRSAPEPGASATRRGALDPALGLIAMAFLPFLGEGHAVEGTGGHAHGQMGSWLAVLLVGLLVGLLVASAASAIWSWRGRPGARNAVAARACMLCSLTTMMVAVVR